MVRSIFKDIKNNESVVIWGASRYGMVESYNILRKRGIDVTSFCDSDSELWGTEIIENIYCINPDDIEQNSIVIIGVKSENATSEIIKYLNNKEINRIITYSELKKNMGYFYDLKKELIFCIEKRFVNYLR